MLGASPSHSIKKDASIEYVSRTKEQAVKKTSSLVLLVLAVIFTIALFTAFFAGGAAIGGQYVSDPLHLFQLIGSVIGNKAAWGMIGGSLGLSPVAISGFVISAKMYPHLAKIRSEKWKTAEEEREVFLLSQKYRELLADKLQDNEGFISKDPEGKFRLTYKSGGKEFDLSFLNLYPVLETITRCKLNYMPISVRREEAEGNAFGYRLGGGLVPYV